MARSSGMSERRTGSETERDFERHAKAVFDRSVREVDSATRARLAQVRRTALDELDARGARRGLGWSLAPAGALAAIVLAVAVLLSQGPRTERGLQPVTAFADFEILLGEDDVEIEML